MSYKWMETAGRHIRRSHRWYGLFGIAQRMEIRVRKVATKLFRKHQANYDAWHELVYVGMTDFGWTITEIFPEEELGFSFWRIRDANSFVLHEAEYLDEAVEWVWENLPR